MGLLLPADHPLRCLMPAIMALFPGFVDLMTAVNNDAGAVAAFSWFLWACVRYVQQPFRVKNHVLIALSTIACLAAKNTAWVAVVLAPSAIALGVLRGRLRLVLWIAAIVGSVSAIWWGFGWGDAAFWYRDTAQSASTSEAVSDTPLGTRALRLDIVPGAPRSALFQLLETDQVRLLRGRVVTFGAWIWANEPMRLVGPRLSEYGRMDASRQLSVGTQPTFLAMTVTLPADLTKSSFVLNPLAPLTRTITVYYDGLVLTDGAFPTNEAPSFSDRDAAAGVWGGRPFTNILRNGSAESDWLFVRPVADRLVRKLMDKDVPSSLVLALPADWRGSGWYFCATTETLFPNLLGEIRVGTRSASGADSLRHSGSSDAIGTRRVRNCVIPPLAARST